MTPSLLEYVVDRSDRLAELGGDWDHFAELNGAPHLVASRILGRWVWDFVTGDALLQLWRTLVDRVRETGVPASVDFRCDAPDRVRLIGAELQPGPDGTVRFSCLSSFEQAREPLPVLGARRSATGPFVLMCSWCKRISTRHGWLEIERAVSAERLLEDEPSSVSHGLCDDCDVNVRRRAGLPLRRGE